MFAADVNDEEVRHPYGIAIESQFAGPVGSKSDTELPGTIEWIASIRENHAAMDGV